MLWREGRREERNVGCGVKKQGIFGVKGVNEGERDVWEHTRGGIFRSIRMGV